MAIPYLYQLQNASYSSLSSADFQIGVVDMDDAGLNNSQISQLHAQDKTLFTYISIGEAEDYRNYWTEGGWSTNKPSFVLGENPDWEGNYLVKFWDDGWQKTMFDRVEQAVNLGYDGMYLDIVDGYQVPQVIKAYNGPDIRQEMIDFVTDLSKYAKSLDPDFKVIPQNAVGLLGITEDQPDVPNTAYLKAIDGLGVEDLWFDDNRNSDWTKDDLAFIQNAVDADKFVLATSYPTQDAKQVAFIDNAIQEGLIPFVGNRDLNGKIDGDNLDILAKMQGHDINFPDDAATTTPPPEPTPEPTPTPSPSEEDMTILGTGKNDILHGKNGDDTIKGYNGHDTLYGAGGDDLLYGASGNDILYGDAGNDFLNGQEGRDKLYGGVGNDDLRGGAGHDYLAGDAGADSIRGGDGDDTILYDANDIFIQGNRGFDTLVVQNNTNIDFSSAAIQNGIEHIEMENGQANQARINIRDVLDNSDGDVLFVTGDNADSVVSNFTHREANETVDGVQYAHFAHHSGAELYVEIGMNMNGHVLI
jgi:cysteinyl-tRNA synthetase